MPRATVGDTSRTKSYTPKVSEIPGFSPVIAQFYKPIENRCIHDGRVVDQLYFKSNGIERMFTHIRFNCLFEINEPIVPRFILDFYSQVKVQTDEHGSWLVTLSLPNIHHIITKFGSSSRQGDDVEDVVDSRAITPPPKHLLSSPSDPKAPSKNNINIKFSTWKFLASDEFSRVLGELLSLVASAGFERGLSMHQNKDEFADVLKKMANFMPGAQDRLAEASPLLLKLIMPFSTSAFAVASEHNEDMVNAEVDGSNPKMTDDTATVQSGDGLDPSSAIGEEAAANPSGV
ncbi:hypothetical protein Tco_0211924 [Tanacetum coccineum]